MGERRPLKGFDQWKMPCLAMIADDIHSPGENIGLAELEPISMRRTLSPSSVSDETKDDNWIKYSEIYPGRVPARVASRAKYTLRRFR